MTTIMYILFSLLGIRSLYHIVWLIIAIRYFAPTQDDRTDEEIRLLDDELHIAIVLPVFDETSTMQKAIKHWGVLLKDAKRIELIVVGSHLDRDSEGNNRTLNLARKMTGECASMRIIEAPNSSFSRAKQVNFAISRITSDPAKTWVLQVDIDSRLSSAAISELVDHVNAGTQIIQQSALFLSNFDKIKAIQKAQALYQSRWTLCHEFSRFMMSANTGKCFYHIVSHGLSINLSLLNEYGGIPKKFTVEDIAFGAHLSTNSEKVTLLRHLELGDTPDSLIDGIHQMYRWSFGPLEYADYWKEYRELFKDRWKSRRLDALRVAALGLTSAVAWNTSSYVLLTTLIYSVFENLAAITFLSLYCIQFIIAGVYFKRCDLMTGRGLLSALCCLPCHMLIRSFPANIALVQKVLKLTQRVRKVQHR